MHASTAPAYHSSLGIPSFGHVPQDDGELRRARAAVASIERVRDQLTATQRALEAHIARAVAEADQRHAAGADPTR